MGVRIARSVSPVLMAALLVFTVAAAPAYANETESAPAPGPSLPTEAEVRVTVDWEHKNDLAFEYLLTNWPVPLEYPYDGDFVSNIGGCPGKEQGGPISPLVLPESKTSYHLRDKPYSLVVTAQGVCSTHDYFEQFAKVEELGKSVKVWATVEFWAPGEAAPYDVDRLGPIQAPIFAQESNHRPYRRKFDADIIPGREPDLSISVDYDTTPFAATVTVKDGQGDPAPDKSVQVTAYIENMKDHFFVYRDDGKRRDQSTEPIPYSVFELLSLPPSGARLPPREIDKLRRWKTDEMGAITVPLYAFDAVELAGYDRHGYLLAGGALPVTFTVRADLVEKDESGVERTLATTAIPVKLDHVAKLVGIRYRADSPATVWVKRGELEEDVSSADVRGGGAYPRGFELRHGDVIVQKERVGTTLKWYHDMQVSMWVLEGKGPKEITIYASSTSAHESIRDWQDVGIATALGGIFMAVATPAKHWGIGQAVVSLLFAAYGAEDWVGVDIVPHSVVLVGASDAIAIHTVEGTVDLYDRGSANMVEVAAGQSVTLDLDSSFGPVIEFELADLDEDLLGLVGSVLGPAPTPAPTPTPTPAPTPTPTPAPTPTPDPAPTHTPATTAPVEPAPSPGPPFSASDRDLWLHDGDTVTRVDHLSGKFLGRWDSSPSDCPSTDDGGVYVGPDGEAAWLTIADATFEIPVLECIVRIPLDGSTALEAYPVPAGRKPTFVNAAAAHGGDLWAMTWRKKSPEKPLSWYDDWSLTRLDRWGGGLTRVLPRVVALTPSDAGLVVLYSEKGARAGARRPLRLGVVEPGGRAPREIALDAALPRTKKGTYVRPRLRLSAGHEGTVALYDEYAARDILVFDPASGAVVGRVQPPEGATSMGRVWPVSDGVWMSGLLEGTDDFVRYVPFDGWASLELDPCTDVAADCYAQVETASDAGAWVSAWPYDGAYEVILDKVIMRRYDTGGQGLAEVTGEELFRGR